ncbi:hypothetical protein [Saccharothrix australiensis]|uniref:WXG100 family type VII secretion target n=1 Tax=Saccharothrix australiensis TaxID=2072 RepID=A0A495W6N1_9PSEU|nr:hypothetical protein [Saccharothrix australiensis]RKT56737.1 hypothetical protein C8E97_5447 [Saccharothrix australiensis]
MSGTFWVDTDGLSRGGDGYGRLADRVHQINLTLLQLAELEGSWGDDDAGKEFAPHYLESRRAFTDGLAGLQDELEFASQGLKSLATRLAEVEGGNARLAQGLGKDFGGLEKKQPTAPQPRKREAGPEMSRFEHIQDRLPHKVGPEVPRFEHIPDRVLHEVGPEVRGYERREDRVPYVRVHAGYAGGNEGRQAPQGGDGRPAVLANAPVQQPDRGVAPDSSEPRPPSAPRPGPRPEPGA